MSQHMTETKASAQYYVGDLVECAKYGTGMVVMVEDDLPQVRGGVLLHVRLGDESVRHFTTREVKHCAEGLPRVWPWDTNSSEN